MDCSCHCNAKCHLLGGLEHRIMEVLWSSPTPLKPSDVQKRLNDHSAYTTITTILQRLWVKKLVRRQKKLNYFVYFPTKPRRDFVFHSLNDLFSRLRQSYGDLFISYLKSYR